MWLLKVVFVSSILGISLGTSAGLTARLLSPINTSLPSVQTPKIILASDNEECCIQSEEDIPSVGQEIVAAQVINGEENVEVTPSPTPIPQINHIIKFAVVTPEPEILETSGSAQSSSTPEPTPQPTSELTNEIPKEGLDPDLIFDLINEHREKLKLTKFLKDENICSLAKSRSLELAGEFLKRRLHVGLYNRDLPYWITENVIAVHTEIQALNWWLNSKVHRRQLEGDYKFSCVACQAFQCSQVFTNFEQK